MKQDTIEYVIDSFIDFKGEEHKIVACALSQTPESDEDGYTLSVGWVDGEYISDDLDFHNIRRVVSVGVSICNPTDSFNEEVGKKKAYDKAKHDPKCPTIYTKDSGVAGKILVKGFLEQELLYLKENPERYIKGYNEAKKKFEEKEALRNKIKNLSDSEKLIIEISKEDEINLEEFSKLIKKAKKAGISINNEEN